MRTTRRPRSTRRHDADAFGAAPLAAAAREILQARLGFLLLAQNRTPQPSPVAVPRWTQLAADPLLRQLLDGKQEDGLSDLSVSADPLRGAGALALLRVEGLERRARLLDAVNDLLEASPDTVASDTPHLLSRLGCLLVPALADFVRLDVLQPDGTLEAGAVVHNGPAHAQGWVPDGAPVLAERVARTGTAEFMDEDAVPAGFGTVACLPLRARGRTLGVLTLGTAGARGLGADDVRLARDVARATAVALDNARLLVQATAQAQGREQALAAVAHELRGPLQVITIASGGLLRAWPGGDALLPERRQVAVIADSAQRMRRLMADLVDLSRVDAGTFSVCPEPVPVRTLLDGAAEAYRPMAAQKGVTLAVAPAPAPALAVLADEERVHQVFANLVANAVRHTPAGGTITFAAALVDGQVEISVADSGAGIAPENLPRVFDRFWTRGKCRGCAGLGLAISRAIVHAHGGAIRAASQPGLGATFTFSLPLAGA